MTIGNATVATLAQIGDPEGDQGISCPGNTIDGSLVVTNSARLAVEGNQVNGSVVLVNSNQVEFGGNTIGGSAVCIGTTPVPPPSPDMFGNTVMGVIDSCPKLSSRIGLSVGLAGLSR